jgi:hypothetical protein
MIALMNHRLLGVGCFVVVAAIVTATTQERSVLPWSPAVQALASPAGPSSGQPQLSASPRGLILSWVERDGQRATLRFAERTSNGWSAPRTVASGNDWFVNWGGCSFRRPPCERNARRALAPEEWPRYLRIRRSSLALAGRWADVVAIVRASQRRNEDRARICLSVSDAWCRSRPGMAGWSCDEVPIRPRRS